LTELFLGGSLIQISTEGFCDPGAISATRVC